MKKVLLMLAVLALAVSLASCGGAATEEVAAPTVAAPTGDGAEATAAALTSQLAIANDKIIEFAYGDHIASLEQVRMVRAIVTTVANSDAMNQIAREGYKLWVVGHACKYGSRAQNNSMGLKRAQQVMYELRALGCPLTNLKAGSKGDVELFSGEGAEHPKQRRITFKVAKRI